MPFKMVNGQLQPIDTEENTSISYPTQREMIETPEVKQERIARETAASDEAKYGPLYERYKGLLDPASQVAPGTVQEFLKAATPEERRDFIVASAYAKKYKPFITEEMKQAFNEPGLITGTEFDLMMAPLGSALGGALGRGATNYAKYKGIKDSVKQGLREGGPETLKRITRETDLANELGAGGLPFTKGIEDFVSSNNIFERGNALDTLRTIKKDAVDRYKTDLGPGGPLKDTAEQFQSAARRQFEELKAPATEAYEKAKALATDEPRYDISAFKENVQQYMREEGADPAEIRAVLKYMEPGGKALTAEQKEALATLEASKKALDDIRVKIAGAEGPELGRLKAQRERLKKKIEDLEGQTDPYSKYLSDLDLLNIPKQLRSLTSNPSMSFKNTEAADRIIKNVGRMFEEEAAKQFDILNPAINPLRKEANQAYSEAMKFRGTTPEFEKLFDKSILPEYTMKSIMSNPQAITRIAENMKDPAAKQALARSIVERAVKMDDVLETGGLPGINFAETARSLKSLRDNPELMQFLRNNLGPEEWEQLQAYESVSNALGNMLKNIEDAPRPMEYITEAPSLLSSATRALGVGKDALGYAKNEIAEKVPGLGFLSSRPGVKEKLNKKIKKRAIEGLTGTTPWYEPTLERVGKAAGAVGGLESTGIFGGENNAKNYNSALFQIEKAGK